METPEGTFRFVKVTRDTLLHFLRGAQKRIVIAKPGYFKEEIDALIEIVRVKNIGCNLFVDPSDNAVRFGFGETEALRAIQGAGSILHCQTASHIRMSVVIVDDHALIYMPVALAWENESDEQYYPNGLIGGKELADIVFREFILQEKAAPAPENERIFQEAIIKQIEEVATKAQLEKSIEKLTENPPVDPSNLEEFTFYRNNFKILKTEIRGVKIENKTISLKPFTMLLPKIDKRLKNSWQVFTGDEVKNFREHKKFLAEIAKVWSDKIEKKDLFDIQRHGHLVRTSAKGDLEKQLKIAKNKFIQALIGERALKDNDSLSSILLRSKKDLVDYIFSNVRDLKQSWPCLFMHDKAMYRDFQNDQSTIQMKEQLLRKAAESFVEEELHFPEIGGIIDAVNVKCDYYDVSDELLRDEDFSAILREHGLHNEIRKYEAGYRQQDNRRKDPP